MSERVAIVGARAHPDLEVVRAYVRSLPADAVVVSGGAEGVDYAALHTAKLRPMAVVEYRPHTASIVDRPCSARDALLYRNTLIALDCDRMVVFPDGSRGGCWDAAREARRFGRPVEIRQVDGRVYEYLGGFAKRRKA